MHDPAANEIDLRVAIEDRARRKNIGAAVEDVVVVEHQEARGLHGVEPCLATRADALIERQSNERCAIWIARVLRVVDDDDLQGRMNAPNAAEQSTEHPWPLERLHDSGDVREPIRASPRRSSQMVSELMRNELGANSSAIHGPSDGSTHWGESPVAERLEERTPRHLAEHARGSGIIHACGGGERRRGGEWCAG